MSGDIYCLSRSYAGQAPSNPPISDWYQFSPQLSGASCDLSKHPPADGINIRLQLISCYRPQRSWGKVIFSEACVKNSVHKGGCLPHGMLGYTPWGPDTPPEQTPPSKPEAGTPLGADTPTPCKVHAGRYGEQAGGTHPAGMHSYWEYSENNDAQNTVVKWKECEIYLNGSDHFCFEFLNFYFVTDVGEARVTQTIYSRQFAEIRRHLTCFMIRTN